MKSIFRILFTFFIAHNSALAYTNDLQKSNISHLVYSTMRSYRDFEYEFDGQFSNERLHQLAKIGENGGSMQSIDCLQYEEFKYVKGRNYKGLDGFETAYRNLLEEMKNFERLKIPNGLIELWWRRMNFLENFEKMFAEEAESISPWMDALIEKERQIRLIEGDKVEFFNNIFRQIRAQKPLHYLAIACKQWIAKLMSEEGVGNWLNLITFIPQSGYNTLSNCDSLSKLQSTELDRLGALAMYRQHFGMRKKTKTAGKELQRTVIVGAGPIGLYTAFQLFLVGMRIFLVNDRPENYIRTQITFLDPKWMVQLRFLLGTKFDVLFRGPGAKGRLNPGETGKINILDLETHLKERLFDLKEIIDGIGWKREELEIWYETAFQEIRASEGGSYLAHLVESKKAKNHNELMEKELAKEEKVSGGILTEKTEETVAEEIFEETLKEVNDEEEGKFAAGSNAEELIKKRGRKNIIGPEGMDISMDFLVCAGGANDRIRDKYLGAPKLMTPERNFGVGMVTKENVEEFIFEDFAVLIDVDDMGKMEKHLERQNFEQIIREEVLMPVELKEKYKNFTKMLKKSDPKRKQAIRIWENRLTIHIAASTPPALEQLLNDVQKVRNKILKKFVQKLVSKFLENCRLYAGKINGWWRRRTTKKKENEAVNKEGNIQQEKINKETNEKIAEITKQFKDLRQKLERNWFLAVFDYALAERHPNKIRIDKIEQMQFGKKINILFNFDYKIVDGHKNGKFVKENDENAPLKLFFTDFNVSTFPLRVQAPKESVKEFEDLRIERPKNEKNSSIAGLIISLGDSNASPHFLTASGLSSGRVGVEKCAITIRDEYLTRYGELNNLKKIMNEKLDSVKKEVEKKAQGFDKSISQK